MLFLAYASFKDFVVYQMDVKSAFLYGKIEEEVYVCQPPGFEDPNFPNRVYKVEKALYEVHQAPRAWYETLSTYLLDNGFQRGKIYKTLFIRRDKGDILLVQVYIDDIIFGSTKKSLCTEFEKIMHKRIGVNAGNSKLMLLGINLPLLEKVNAVRRNLLLLVLMLLGINLQLLVNVNAVEVAFLEKPTKSEGFEEIVNFLNANPTKYALSVNPTVYCLCIRQFWDTVKAKTVNGEVQLQALVDKKKVIIIESTIRRDLQLEDAEGTECLPTATIFEELTRMGYEKLTQKLTFYKAFFSPQ
ncbi:putative ribonuclease H-like domain-containing protein [Tanacetum coccineum]